MSVAYSGLQNVCSKFHDRNSKTSYSLYRASKQTKSTQNLYNFYFLDFFLKITKKLSPGEQGRKEKKKRKKKYFPAILFHINTSKVTYFTHMHVQRTFYLKIPFTHNMCSLRIQHVIRLASPTLPNLIFLFSFSAVNFYAGNIFFCTALCIFKLVWMVLELNR